MVLIRQNFSFANTTKSSLVCYFLHSIFSAFSISAVSFSMPFFINTLPNLSAKSQSDYERSSPLQTLDLTQSLLHIKCRPPVLPKPPPEKQVVWSCQLAVKTHKQWPNVPRTGLLNPVTVCKVSHKIVCVLILSCPKIYV